jgi:flavin reductase (DIM6/NTAB) family NADH-FMN oxidoreductase RutF
VEGRLVDVELCDDGVPLIADSAARFEVTIDDQCPAGDHTMVLLRVHRTEIDETLSPLIFHRSGFATLR